VLSKGEPAQERAVQLDRHRVLIADQLANLGKIAGTGELATTLALDCAGEPAATYTEEFTVRGKATPGRLALLFRDQTDTCLGIAADPTVSIGCWAVPGGKIKRSGKQAPRYVRYRPGGRDAVPHDAEVALRPQLRVGVPWRGVTPTEGTGAL